jgi:OOP family OmpA-OmpF porin
MNVLCKLAVVGIAAVGLSACAGTEYPAAQKMAPSGSGHTADLSKGYLMISGWEYGEGDYTDSDGFAMKSMEAGGGATVPVPDMGSRNIPQEYVGDISAARQRLVTALNAGGASVAPADSAEAQVMLECWMQEAEENWPFQAADRAQCRDGFNEAMARVEAALAPAPQPVAAPGSYLVFFDFAKYNLTPEAVDIVNAAAAGIVQTPGAKVSVVGNTDTVGSAQFNMVLGQKRADAVAAQLMSQGVSEAAITTSSDGFDNLLVPTGAGVAEPQNRRASITIQKPGM